MNTLAIDIGGTKFSLALFSGDQMIARHSAATDRSGGPSWMVDRIAEVARGWITAHGIEGCGIGFGGPVDFPKQRVICSTHVDGWSNYDLVGELQSKLGIPAVIERDSLVGALGEGRHGAGRGQLPLLYITLSTGIGGGLLTADGLYRGANSFACELGHHTVLPDGPDCLCGSRGCLERMCCGLWLQRDHGRPAHELLQDAAFVQGYVVHLAQGLKNSIMFLNPACIVIGGGISKAGDRLFGPLRAELNRQMPQWSLANRAVVQAQLGDDSVLWGALELARSMVPRAVAVEVL
jgi:glucokinase